MSDEKISQPYVCFTTGTMLISNYMEVMEMNTRLEIMILKIIEPQFNI